MRFNDPWSFFDELQSFSPENRHTKQWAVLAETLLRICEKHFPEDRGYVIDLLRFDWCPYATGQTFPAFLRTEQDNRIKEIRREAYQLFEKEITGFSRRDFNHSILYVPATARMKEEHCGKITLFYRKEKNPVPVSVTYNPE